MAECLFFVCVNPITNSLKGKVNPMTKNLSDAEKIAVFRKIAEYWKTKQWRAICDLMTPDVVLQNMMFEPVTGREHIYKRWSNMSPPNKTCTLQILRIGVVEGALVVERRDEITVDGVSRSVAVVGILEFDGPLISQWREYYDRSRLLWAQGSTAGPY